MEILFYFFPVSKGQCFPGVWAKSSTHYKVMQSGEGGKHLELSPRFPPEYFEGWPNNFCVTLYSICYIRPGGKLFYFQSKIQDFLRSERNILSPVVLLFIIINYYYY